MTSPTTLTAALRHHAEGSYCLAAAADLLISQHWLHRGDFTDRFITVGPAAFDDRTVACVDWPAAIHALDTGDLPCSGGEQRMLRLTAGLADGIPVDLRETPTGIDSTNVQLLVRAVLHASGRRPASSRYCSCVRDSTRPSDRADVSDERQSSPPADPSAHGR